MGSCGGAIPEVIEMKDIGQERKPKNSPPRYGDQNRMPRGDAVEPLEEGLAGLRYLADHYLMSTDGWGPEARKRMGLDLRKVARQIDDLVAVLVNIAIEDRQPLRQQERGAAIRILGHQRVDRAEAAIATLLAAEDEDPKTRAAAADALGMLRTSGAESALQRAVASSHDKVARAAASALSRFAGENGIKAIEKRLGETKDPGVQSALRRAINRIEIRGGKEVSGEVVPQPASEKFKVTSEFQIILDENGHLIEQPKPR